MLFVVWSVSCVGCLLLAVDRSCVICVVNCLLLVVWCVLCGVELSVVCRCACCSWCRVCCVLVIAC